MFPQVGGLVLVGTQPKENVAGNWGAFLVDFLGSHRIS